MRSRNLIILVVAVVALGAYIFFFERHQPSTGERLERADRVFPQLDESTLTSVEIETDWGRTRMAKTDEGWLLVEPIDYPADEAAVRSLVGSIVNLDAERILPLGEVELGDYGLEDPKLGIVLVDSDGRQFSLTVGDKTPLGSNRAVRRDRDEEIVLCSEAFVAGLEKDVDQWRSRDVVDLLEQGLASVTIETPSDRIRAEQIDGHWQLREPLVDLADRDQMQSLISELNTLRVGEFLPVDGDSGGLGLDPPAFRVVLTRVEEEPVTLELAAAENGEGAGLVVCRRNGVDLFRVPDSIATRLSKAPVLWRSDKVWPFSSWDVTRVEIENEEEEFHLRQKNGLWQLEDGGQADAVDVRRRLTALADLVVREHDLMLPPTEVMGSVVLELEEAKGPEVLTLTFYAPIEEGGHAAVTVIGRDNVMGIDAASAETIVGDLEKLRSTGASQPAGE